MKSLRDVAAGGAITFAFLTGYAHGQDVLPRPDPSFRGVMSPDVRKSTEDWPADVKAPKGAPNILLILVDDVGFSATHTFGGAISTPTFDGLAHQGLRYNEFHVNSICAPSRASLLSGRTDHQVGFGSISEFGTGYPGYNTLWPKSAASVAEVLKDNGYNTAAFGKWHNTPAFQATPAGPFDRWPTGLGFEYFYGFLSAFDSQYYPRLYRDTTPVEPPKSPREGYSLTEDMANDAIRWLHLQQASSDKPFFLYFATAATHTPHQVPEKWVTPYKGKFDEGWDKLREETFQRQKKLGVIPANAEDTPRPKGLPAWDSLPESQRKLLTRQAEVYAGFTTQADYEIGRLIQAIKDEGKADNTIIIEIFGDNGGCAEDGPTGYDARDVHGVPLKIDQRLAISDKLGSEVYMNAAAAAWAWSFTTPLQGTKADASHLGGTRDPMIMVWPERIRQGGGLRSQFTHLDDVAPTLYDAAGITPPKVVNGVEQMPLYGTSFLYTIDHPNEPSQHHVQVFETNGNKAIYKDGWWAGQLLRSSWDRIGGPGMSDKELLDGNLHPWELYNLNDDYSQAHNLADKDPQKLKEMEALFDEEARKTNIYPILPLRGLLDKPLDEKTTYVYRTGVERLQDTANLKLGGGKPYTVTADVDVPNGPANGVIMAQGGRYGGTSLFVKDGRVFYEVNVSGNRAGQLVSTVKLNPGKAHIVLHVKPDSEGSGGAEDDQGVLHRKSFPATATLTINGSVAGEAHFVNVPGTGGYWSGAETLDIGSDLGSAVSSDYESPNRFDGTINTVTVSLE
jgi:arylsulfatase